jgi:hypothetical protein
MLVLAEIRLGEFSLDGSGDKKPNTVETTGAEGEKEGRYVYDTPVLTGRVRLESRLWRRETCQQGAVLYPDSDCVLGRIGWGRSPLDG